MSPLALVHPVLALALAPLLVGVIGRTKAFFAGRSGPPLIQPYRDLGKLLGKGAVVSTTTSWLFRAAPALVLAAVGVALLVVPLGGQPAALAFPGDVFLFAYALALARFFTVLAALDTGSSFEGMGASREAAFSALAEPALLLGLLVVGRTTGEDSLSAMLLGLDAGDWWLAGPVLVLVAAALLVVVLAENARIPVDDPATHLELTMIHEVMILDHGGPDLAFLLYAAALKLWLLGALLVGIVLPFSGGAAPLGLALGLAGLLALAVLVGVIESTMARLRLVRVPHLLVGAIALSTVAVLLVSR